MYLFENNTSVVRMTMEFGYKKIRFNRVVILIEKLISRSRFIETSFTNTIKLSRSDSSFDGE